MKALQDRGGADLEHLTAEEAEDLATLADYHGDVRAAIESFRPARAVKALGGSGTASRGPGYGRGDARGDNAGTDTKAEDGSIQVLEDEDDKYLRHGPWKSLGHFATPSARAASGPACTTPTTRWASGMAGFARSATRSRRCRRTSRRSPA